MLFDLLELLVELLFRFVVSLEVFLVFTLVVFLTTFFARIDGITVAGFRIGFV